MKKFTDLAASGLTAHELAKMLMEMPDYPITVMGYGNKINNIEEMNLIFSPDPLHERGREVVFSFDTRKLTDEEINESNEFLEDENEDEDVDEEFNEDWIKRIEERKLILTCNDLGFFVATAKDRKCEGRTKIGAIIGLISKLFNIKDQTNV